MKLRTVLSFTALSGALLAAPAMAQIVIGGGGSSNSGVIINLDAIDGAGAPERQRMGRPPLPGEMGQITLRPPRSQMTVDAPAVVAAPPARAPQSTLRLPPASAPAPAAMPAPTTAAVAPAPPPAVARPSAPPPPPAPPVAQSRLGEAPRAPVAPATPPAPPPQAAAPTPAPAAPAPQAAAPAAPPPVAALTPSAPAAASVGSNLRLSFAANAADITPETRTQIEAFGRQYASGEARVTLRAYGSGAGADNATAARRLALSRALAVRSLLIEQGIRSTRIDVRALGQPQDGGSPDRVEISLGN